MVSLGGYAMVPCLLLYGITFALCELGRPPYMAHWGQSLRMCVPGRALTPLARCNTQTLCQSLCAKGPSPLESLRRVYACTQENGKISRYRGVLSWGSVVYSDSCNKSKFVERRSIDGVDK